MGVLDTNSVSRTDPFTSNANLEDVSGVATVNAIRTGRHSPVTLTDLGAIQSAFASVQEALDLNRQVASDYAARSDALAHDAIATVAARPGPDAGLFSDSVKSIAGVLVALLVVIGVVIYSKGPRDEPSVQDPVRCQ